MRFPPIPPEQWNDAQRTVASAIMSGPRGELRGPFVPLLHSPGLAAHVQGLGEYIRFGTGIPDDVLEIAILMTARKRECPHIWASHSRLASKAGVSEAIIDAIRQRNLPDGDERVIAVSLLCHDLLETNRIGDAAYQRAEQLWGKQGVMDIVATCGYYGLLAMVLNTAAGADNPTDQPAGF
jgi:4-carboxymuconolactone decarboxylase